jgi:hypothetical protein
MILRSTPFGSRNKSSFRYLREESHKFREQFITDKLVHLPQDLTVNHNSFFLVSEQNLDICPWIELHFVLGGERDGHHCAFVELLNLNLDSFRDGDNFIGDRGVETDSSVLVEITQCIQLPQTVEFVGIPTVVRLYRLHDGDCGIGDPECLFSNPDLCIHRILSADGETEFPRRRLGVKQGELPSQIIEARPEATDELSGTKSYREGDFFEHFDCDAVESSLRIFLRRNSIGIDFLELPKLEIERQGVFSPDPASNRGSTCLPLGLPPQADGINSSCMARLESTLPLV